MELIFIAAKAREKLREEKNYTKKHTKKEQKTYDYQPREMTYLDALYQELAYHNPSLFDFFLSLEKEYSEGVNAEINKLEAEIKEDTKEFEEKESRFLKLKKQLEKHEINIDFKRDIYHYPYKIIKNIFFNNHPININYFYDSSQEKTICLEKREQKMSELAELEKKLNQFKKKFYFSPSKRKENKSSRNYYINEIKTCKENIDLYNQTIMTFEKIENLPQEVRDILSNAIFELNGMIQIEEKNFKRKCLIRTHEGNRRENNYDNQRLESTFKRMFEEGKINENKLASVFLQMDKVEIKSRRGEYLSGHSSSDILSAKSLEELITWFIENIYEADENFVKNNKNITDDNDIINNADITDDNLTEESPKKLR